MLRKENGIVRIVRLLLRKEEFDKVVNIPESTYVLWRKFTTTLNHIERSIIERLKSLNVRFSALYVVSIEKRKRLGCSGQHIQILTKNVEQTVY